MGLATDGFTPCRAQPSNYNLPHQYPHSSKTHPKYLNSETYSKRIPSTHTSHHNPSSPRNTSTLLLHALTSDLFSHILQENVLLSPLILHPTHLTKPSQLHTRGQAISTLFPSPEISCRFSPSLFSPPSSLRPYIH